MGSKPTVSARSGLPLLIRAGSIVPLGPQIDYADQKFDDLIERRIYCINL